MTENCTNHPERKSCARCAKCKKPICPGCAVKQKDAGKDILKTGMFTPMALAAKDQVFCRGCAAKKRLEYLQLLPFSAGLFVLMGAMLSYNQGYWLAIASLPIAALLFYLWAKSEKMCSIPN